MLVSFQQLHDILIEVIAFVFLLDTAAAGRKVTGYRKTQDAAVRQDEVLLHQTFAKGAPAHDERSVIILEGTCKNLTGAGAVLVDKDCKFDILECPLTVTVVRMIVLLALAACGDDRLS